MKVNLWHVFSENIVFPLSVLLPRLRNAVFSAVSFYENFFVWCFKFVFSSLSFYGGEGLGDLQLYAGIFYLTPCIEELWTFSFFLLFSHIIKPVLRVSRHWWIVPGLLVQCLFFSLDSLISPFDFSYFLTNSAKYFSNIFIFYSEFNFFMQVK